MELRKEAENELMISNNIAPRVNPPHMNDLWIWNMVKCTYFFFLLLRHTGSSYTTYLRHAHNFSVMKIVRHKSHHRNRKRANYIRKGRENANFMDFRIGHIC